MGDAISGRDNKKRIWQGEDNWRRSRTIRRVVARWLPYASLPILSFGSVFPFQAVHSFLDIDMSPDNNLCGPCRLKKTDVSSSPLQCCRGSGQFMIPPSTMPAFEPRPFPPPSLSGVPIEYITGQLHNLASQFWDKPDTADCTISALPSFSTQHLVLTEFIQLFLFPMLKECPSYQRCRKYPSSNPPFRLLPTMKARL